MGRNWTKEEQADIPESSRRLVDSLNDAGFQELSRADQELMVDLLRAKIREARMAEAESR